MTEAPTTQLVSVSLGLAGEQYARITLTHAGTRHAEMSLLWGSLLLTLNTEAQVENLKLAWFSAAPLVRTLPANLGSLAVLSGIDPECSNPASSCGCTVKQPTGPSSTSPPATPTGAAWPTSTS